MAGAHEEFKQVPDDDDDETASLKASVVHNPVSNRFEDRGYGSTENVLSSQTPKQNEGISMLLRSHYLI